MLEFKSDMAEHDDLVLELREDTLDASNVRVFKQAFEAREDAIRYFA